MTAHRWLTKRHSSLLSRACSTEGSCGSPSSRDRRRQHLLGRARRRGAAPRRIVRRLDRRRAHPRLLRASHPVFSSRAADRVSARPRTSLSVTPPTMHSPFVLAEKTLGAPNFASCGHQTGALPPISALPIYPHTATAGDAQMRLPGPLTSPEPRRLGTARREPAGKELAEPSPASLPAHGRSKGRSPARRLPPLSQPLPATGSRT